MALLIIIYGRRVGMIVENQSIRPVWAPDFVNPGKISIRMNINKGMYI